MSRISFEDVVSRVGPTVRHGGRDDVRGECPLCHTHGLAITRGLDGSAVVCCHATRDSADPCNAHFGEMMRALGAMPERPVQVRSTEPPRELPPLPLRIGAPYPGTTRAIIRAFGYEDEHGVVRYCKLRLEGDDNRFRLARPVDRIRWNSAEDMLAATTWRIGPGCMDGIARRLYREPIVRAVASEGGVVFILEGERDAEALNSSPDWSHNHVATTTGDAGSWNDKFTVVLRGASEVRVYGDPDDAGREYTATVARSLKTAGIRTRRFEVVGR